MKTLVIYYSLSGSTKREAERIASELQAELCEVKERKKRSGIAAFIPGCPQAMKRKATQIEPLTADLASYDKIIIGAPIWASHPAPAWNSIAALLPQGKEVELFFLSGGGDSSASAQGSREIIEGKGCTVTGYRDVKKGN